MFAYCDNNAVNYIDQTGNTGVYFADYTIYALSGALAGLVAGISSIKASIEAALALVSIPVICIAAVAVAVASVVYLVATMRELSVMAEDVIAWTKSQVLEKKYSEKQLHGYTVYVIVYKNTTDAAYVGMQRVILLANTITNCDHARYMVLINMK